MDMSTLLMMAGGDQAGLSMAVIAQGLKSRLSTWNKPQRKGRTDN
jgi:hypothetical protein